MIVTFEMGKNIEGKGENDQVTNIFLEEAEIAGYQHFLLFVHNIFSYPCKPKSQVWVALIILSVSSVNVDKALKIF